MRKLLDIIILLAGLFLLWNCSGRGVYDAGEPVPLELSIRIPLAQITKSEIAEVHSLLDERSIRHLQIWVFRSYDGQPVGYLEPAVNNLQSGTTQRFSIFVLDEIARQMPEVDVYVLANGANLALNKNSSRSSLEAAMLSGGNFGVANPVSSIPEGGLPFSGMAKNMAMSGTYPVLEVGTVTLTRAVSKVQLILSRVDNEMVDDFILEGFRLEGQIGAQERVFTTATYSGHTLGSKLFDIAGGGYSSLSFNLPLPSSIPANDNPAEFTYRSEGHEGESPDTYERRVEAAVTDGRLASAGVYYFRETDKKLSGIVSYRIGATGATKTANFTMEAEGDFARNHCWVVYAYFIGGKLFVKPTIVPWIAGHKRFQHVTQGSVEMGHSIYLRFDEDRKADSWGDSDVSIAYGFISGVPRFAPMITLHTNNNNDLRLQLDNEDFQFVRKNGTSFALAGQLIIIKGNSEENLTEFYVVPVSAETPVDPIVNVRLVEISSGGMPPVNLPFNLTMPGSIDRTTMRFRNIGAATYSANQYNAKQTGSDQPTQYWIELED